jgi:hypothetical protein
MSVQERVARGVRWLDGVRPGWRDALELSRLSLASGHDCVLGQVFAEEAAASRSLRPCGYSYAKRELVPDAAPDWAAIHGFIVGLEWLMEEALVSGDIVAMCEAEQAALEDEWCRVIHIPREDCAASVRS